MSIEVFSHHREPLEVGFSLAYPTLSLLLRGGGKGSGPLPCHGAPGSETSAYPIGK